MALILLSNPHPPVSFPPLVNFILFAPGTLLNFFRRSRPLSPFPKACFLTLHRLQPTLIVLIILFLPITVCLQRLRLIALFLFLFRHFIFFHLAVRIPDLLFLLFFITVDTPFFHIPPKYCPV